ncbi:HtaA domain-containing protein [Streptomyces sp. NPDC127098]|uniref:HtaA domain-containing protein n=1 Tax=Streptomyces sp. NPDC127098 TaxID=3347137 RepID=UPI003647A1B7
MLSRMLPGHPRPRALLSLATLLPLALPVLLALSLAPLSGVAHAAERAVAGGRLDWGIRSSFQSYVTGPIAGGSWTLSGGAATVGQSQFRFHSASGDYDPETGALTAGYSGGVRFVGHQQDDGSYELDLTISNPTVSVAGSSGTLYADMRGKARGSGEITESTQVPLAALDLTGVDLRGGTRIAVSAIPATLTAEGATAFAGYYQAGEALDPVTLTADTEDPEPAATETEPEPEETGEEQDQPAEGTGEFADAVVDWGVRRTFREYVTGEIAAGGWTLTDGAQDGGALFRFPAGRGTADPEAGTLQAEFDGAVTFTGTDLDLTLGGVTVSVADGTGTLAADVTASEQGQEEDLPLVTFAAEPERLAPRDGLILLTEVPAQLTEQGAAAFGGLYRPGTEMDPITLAVALDPDAELPALPDLGSEPTAAAEPATGEPYADEESVQAEDIDRGASALTLFAIVAGLLLALAALAFGILRRNRRAGPKTTTDTTPSEETDPA